MSLSDTDKLRLLTSGFISSKCSHKTNWLTVTEEVSPPSISVMSDNHVTIHNQKQNQWTAVGFEYPGIYTIQFTSAEEVGPEWRIVTGMNIIPSSGCSYSSDGKLLCCSGYGKWYLGDADEKVENIVNPLELHVSWCDATLYEKTTTNELKELYKMSRYLCNINDWNSSDDNVDEEITTHEPIVFAFTSSTIDIDFTNKDKKTCKKDEDKEEEEECCTHDKPPPYSKVICYRFSDKEPITEPSKYVTTTEN